MQVKERPSAKAIEVASSLGSSPLGRIGGMDLLLGMIGGLVPAARVSRNCSACLRTGACWLRTVHCACWRLCAAASMPPVLECCALRALWAPRLTLHTAVVGLACCPLALLVFTGVALTIL